MQLVRRDKSDGTVENESRDRVRTLVQREYPTVWEKVWGDLIEGEREFHTEFAVYYVKGFVPFAKR